MRIILSLVACCIGLLQSIHAHAQADKNTIEEHNRSLQISTSLEARNYREIDAQGLTPDGILNTELGNLSGIQAQLRWQGHLSQFPLFVQLKALRHTGQTRYQGYLQSNTGLTPYSAFTGNDVRAHAASLDISSPRNLPWKLDDFELKFVSIVYYLISVVSQRSLEESELI